MRPTLNGGLRHGRVLHGWGTELSGALVFIESNVRALQKFLGCLAGLVVGPATRKMEADFVAGEVEFQALEPAENMANLFGAALREDSHEFIAAQADGKVGTANGALQAIGETLQQGITGSVAVIVIDQFESVHVHEEDGEWPGVALGAADFLREALLAGTAIVKSGELIESREFVDFGSQRFHLRERLNLVGHLMMQTHDLRLLINQIHTEDQNKTDESAHGLIQEKRIGALFVVEHSGEGKRRHSESEQQNHGDRGGP